MLFSIVHGEESYMKETYTRSEMLVFEVAEDELVDAETEAGKKAKLFAEKHEIRKQSKCLCFPWVRIFFSLFIALFLILFCRLITAPSINCFGLLKAGDMVSYKATRQQEKLKAFGKWTQGLDAVANLTPKLF